ncbi:MAG: fimbrial biogenesis chaperone [Stenotrophomonas sp.]|uniref:fimbrial biogenesis chaperone n=1 Tax=Stenotrophomonas sp. TaxID=69392 RepID=UPI003D6D989F
MRILLIFVLLLACATARAGVTAERTRVIFNAGDTETALRVVNQNSYPVVVQAWIDDGDPESTPDTAEAPIIPLPPVFRLEPGEQRSLRLVSVGATPPSDRESLYWLNLYEIPPDAARVADDASSRLTVTLRTQMKVIHRPKGLSMTPQRAVARMEFRVEEGRMAVLNPTPYVMTLSGISLCSDPQEGWGEGALVRPFAQVWVALPASNCARSTNAVRFSWIDDDGNIQQGSARLQGAQS